MCVYRGFLYNHLGDFMSNFWYSLFSRVSYTIILCIFLRFATFLEKGGFMCVLDISRNESEQPMVAQLECFAFWVGYWYMSLLRGFIYNLFRGFLYGLLFRRPEGAPGGPKAPFTASYSGFDIVSLRGFIYNLFRHFSKICHILRKRWNFMYNPFRGFDIVSLRGFIYNLFRILRRIFHIVSLRGFIYNLFRHFSKICHILRKRGEFHVF